MLQRRFHLADVLALLLDPSVSWRGEQGAEHVARFVLARNGDKSALQAHDFATARSAIVSAHPEFFALLQDELPPPAFADLWLRRRCREFGTYVSLPRLRFRCSGSFDADADPSPQAQSGSRRAEDDGDDEGTQE